METTPNFDYDPASFSLEAVKAKVLAAAELQRDYRNEQLKQIYLQAFANWKGNVDAGRIPNTDPPQPPAAFVVKTVEDWPLVDEGDQPVCEMPAIPEDRVTQKPVPAMTIDITHSADQGAGTWFAVGPDDSWPVGKQTPPIELPGLDGLHVCLRVGTAVGKGWYERLN